MTTPAQPPLLALACGGTGGHLFPGLAVAAELKRANCSVMLFVSAKVVDQEAVRDAAGMEIVRLPAVGLTRGSGFAFIRAFRESYCLSKQIFKTRRPQAALAMGGFTSAPPILAARACGAQTFLHESNTIAGRANRWLSWLVERAFIGFPSAAARLHTRKVSLTGTPVRSEFVPRDPSSCRASFGLDPAREVVLVMGGSQGARAINQFISRAAPLVAQRCPAVQWLHLAGPNDTAMLEQAYRGAKLHAVVRPFCHTMELALGAATVAVARAGASSLAELAAMRVPAILIPYPTATDNHQLHNARAFEQTRAACVLVQADVTPEKLAESLSRLIEDRALRETMRQALVGWHTPLAAEQIVQAMLDSARSPDLASPQASARRASHHHSSALA